MSEEQHFGREANEITQGYTPLSTIPWSNTALEKKDDTSLTVEEAAQSIDRGSPPEPVVRDLNDFRDKGEKVSLTPKEAGRLLSDQHRIEADNAQYDADRDFAEKVIDARYGSDASLGTLLNGAAQPAEQPAAPTNQPTNDGLRPEVRAALEMPEVRQAIQQEFSQAQEVRAQYEAAIGETHRMATAAIYAIAPELANVPQQNIPGALQMLAQSDPQRHAFIANQLQIAEHMRHQGAQIEHQRQQEHAHAVDAWGRQEEASFAKKFPVFADAQQAPVEQQKVRNYLVNNIGFTQDELTRAYHDGTLRRSAVQEIAYKAYLYDQATERAKSATPQVRPVQRPGTGGGGRGAIEAAEARIASSERRLPSLRGNKSVKEAVKLLRAKREAGR